jgi:hypothetical protein
MFPLLFFKSGNIGRRYMEEKWAKMLKKLDSLRKNLFHGTYDVYVSDLQRQSEREGRTP